MFWAAKTWARALAAATCEGEVPADEPQLGGT